MLSEAITTFLSRATYKARQQEMLATSVTLFIRSSPHKGKNNYYAKAIRIPLDLPTNHHNLILPRVLEGLRAIFKPNIKYHNAIIDKMSDIPEEMVCIHLWNEVLRRNKIDKNSTFDPDSLFELFKKKHGIM